MNDYLNANISKPLSPKRKAFVQARIDNPTDTLADQVIKAGYNPVDKHSASQMGGELLRIPEVKQALEEHSKIFESVIVGTARDWGASETPRKREIALDASKYGYDHIYGKSTVKVQQQTNVVHIAINLTGDGEEDPKDIIDLTNE